MNRRVDIDLEVQWPPAKTSERWAVKPKAGEGADEESQPEDEALADTKAVEEDLRTYGSCELFEGAKEVGIKHAGSVYRLKITRQGKLILNK